MKKIMLSILMFMLLLFPCGVMAEGYISTSTKTLTIEEGSSKTFTIVAYNAIGDVEIISEDTTVATVNTRWFETGMVEEKDTKKSTITVKGVGVGTTKIKLDVFASTFTGEKLNDKDQVIVVNVVEKKVDTRSKNNKLKSLSIEGENLVKVNDNNYTLEVSNGVTSIKIVAEAEDAKAKITGVGIYDLKVGVNNITVTVTAENGSKNKIDVKVTRKDGYYLDDLDDLLDGEDKDLEIVLSSSDKEITKEDIDNIIKSKKIVKFNQYGDNKKLEYSLIIDGNMLKQSGSVTTDIKKVPSDDKIYEAVNYADGVYLSLANNGSISNGVRISVNVSGKYVEGDTVNAYTYDGRVVKLISSGIVSNGYIEFELLDKVDYFITKAELNVVKNKEELGMNIYLIISIVELGIIILLSLIVFKKKLRREKIKLKDSIFVTEDNIFLNN